MSIWWCEVHKAESTNQLDHPEDQSACWLYMDFPEKPDGPCRMVPMRLIPEACLVATMTWGDGVHWVIPAKFFEEPA